jgi:glycosyltransferase involved in cell wall biosynthesis
VLPSEREGMPNSMLEAMASSIPVIITPFSGLAADLGKKGQHYLLAERSVDDLKRHIDRLITDPERRKELGQNGLVWVTQNMDLASSLDKYADMYKRLAEAQVNLPGLSASDRGKSEPASGWNRSIGD